MLSYLVSFRSTDVIRSKPANENRSVTMVTVMPDNTDSCLKKIIRKNIKYVIGASIYTFIYIIGGCGSCHPNAFCSQDHCVCNPGYIGDGYDCDVMQHQTMVWVSSSGFLYFPLDLDPRSWQEMRKLPPPPPPPSLLSCRDAIFATWSQPSFSKQEAHFKRKRWNDAC